MDIDILINADDATLRDMLSGLSDEQIAGLVDRLADYLNDNGYDWSV